MKKKWIFPKEDWNAELAEETLRGGSERLLRGLLDREGISDEDAIQEFLSDKPQLTYDPFLLKDMEPAVDRILQACERGEKICIYGDYDADGVTATSLMLEILACLTDQIFYYIPSRFDEGYGLNVEAMETIASCGIHLLITVDCGSVSPMEVKRARELGMDVIVTDHHNTEGRERADCLLINPKQEDCGYPWDGLCGCGVAFKVAQGLQRRSGKISRADLNRELDLVAISTIGDIVPLLDENRTMVKHGIRCIARGGRPGLEELIRQTGLKDRNLSSDQIAFTIVPHLNAAGRMFSARTGVELLTAGRLPALSEIRAEGVRTIQISKNELQKTVEEKAAFLVKNNQERKKVQEQTFQQCLKQIEQEHQDDLFYVIAAEDAHEGIAGIVAGKIKDHFYRPAILVTRSGENGEFWKGTGRSLDGVDLFSLLSEQEERFVRFGGHAGACGFLMEERQLSGLREGLSQAIEALLAGEPELLTPKLPISAKLSGREVSLELAGELERLAPFGHCNPKPCFAVCGLVIRNIFYMGAERQHVKITVAAPECGEFQCVLFQRAAEFTGQLETWMEQKRPVDVAGSLEVNQWNGQRRIQMILEDIQ